MRTDAVKHLLAQVRPKAGSLAVTIFGDCISQHGGTVWLGSLVLVMEKFGLNSRQIRTAVFRLVQNGWLKSKRFGRRSLYGLSTLGMQDYGRATSQIYRAGFKTWDGSWTILVCDKDSFLDYPNFRRRLHWLGFGELAGATFVHPSLDKDMFNKLIDDSQLDKRVTVWDACLANNAEQSQVLRKAWNFDRVQARYEEFILRFSSLSPITSTAGVLNPADAFLVRILLIHEYRRILLKVADLPKEILPPSWPGSRAMSLAKQIYRSVSGASQVFVTDNLENQAGMFAAPVEDFYTRFRQ